MKKPDIAEFKFTPTELRVARLLAAGEDRRTISDNLNIAVSTIDIHSKNIRRKMHVSSSFRCGVILAKFF